MGVETRFILKLLVISNALNNISIILSYNLNLGNWKNGGDFLCKFVLLFAQIVQQLNKYCALVRKFL